MIQAKILNSLTRNTMVYRTYLDMKRLWKSDRRRSLTNSLPSCFSVPRAWFLKTTSSSQRRFMLKSWELRSGFPRAISTSRCSSSSAARSCSYESILANCTPVFKTWRYYLFLLLCCPFFFDLLQLPHQLGGLILIVAFLVTTVLF